MAKLTAQTLVPIGAVIAAVLMTVGVMRVYSADTARTAMLKVQVDALEQRVARNESRLDKSDERWDAIKEDLAKIKERLGIVEAQPLTGAIGQRQVRPWLPIGQSLLRGKLLRRDR